jgi:hypothetical protein
MISEGIISALKAWGDLRDRTLEQIFLAVYSAPLLQALLGMRATDDSPRPQPSIEPERKAFIEARIAELKAGIAEGGVLEAAIRSLLYIGLAGPGADERAFNQLRLMRNEYGGLTLEEFKRLVREQFFALMLEPEGALAAIPKMIPADADTRSKTMGAILAVLTATGDVTAEQAERLARIEALWGQTTLRPQQARR